VCLFNPFFRICVNLRQSAGHSGFGCGLPRRVLSVLAPWRLGDLALKVFVFVSVGVNLWPNSLVAACRAAFFPSWRLGDLATLR
jgi:hypothetical protein